MKSKQQRSGTVRCQRCLKYGHYTYECKNEVVYRYRPSATVMFKEKMKFALNQDKGPQTIIKNPDRQRRIIEDRPSSDDQQGEILKLQRANKQAQIEEKLKIQENEKAMQVDEQQEDDNESQSSSNSQSSSSSSSSSDSDSDSESESGPKKKIKK